jgi:hypothetical protein
MEQTYWLSRKRASAANARRAGSAEARLAHLDLAGRYSIKAAQSAAPAGEQPCLQLELPAAAAATFRPDRARPALTGPPRIARPGPSGDDI